MTETGNQAAALFLQSKDDVIRHSLDLIRIPSITGNLEANIRCLEYLAEIAVNEGIKTTFSRKKDCLVMEQGEAAGGEKIGVLTHVDVVDIGDRSRWKTPPFEGRFDGKHIVGRGAMDDKVPTAIIFNLLRTLKKMNRPLTRGLMFIVGTSEEGEWTDMESFRREFTIPDFSFTPDGAFPIHNIEKGYADVEITAPLEREFGSGSIVELAGGDSPNTIPSTACFVYRDRQTGETVTLTGEGRSAHSSLPEQGDNAITRLALLIRERRLDHPSLDKMMDFIARLHGDCSGRFLGFKNDNLFYNGEYTGDTKANPTVIRLMGEKLLLNINIRHRPGVTRGQIEGIFHRLSEEYGFAWRITGYQEPLYLSRDNKFFPLMNRAYEAVTGLPGGFSPAGGSSYAKALPDCVCWGPVFPGEEDSCHRENEKMSLESIIKCIEIYGRFLFEACTGCRQRQS